MKYVGENVLNVYCVKKIIHQHAESSRLEVLGGPYCDSIVNSRTETYAVRLIFVLTCNNLKGSIIQGTFTHHNGHQYMVKHCHKLKTISLQTLHGNGLPEEGKECHFMMISDN